MVEEFEKAYLKADVLDGEQNDFKVALWGALWMAEKIALKMQACCENGAKDCVICSPCMEASAIRTLAQKLRGEGNG